MAEDERNPFTGLPVVHIGTAAYGPFDRLYPAPADVARMNQVRALATAKEKPKRARDMITLARAEPPKPAAPVVYGEEPDWMKRMRQPSRWRRFLRWCGL